MSDILKRSISEHADALERKEYSSVELTGAFLERIERENSEINAYVTVAHESALNCARESDERRARGEARGALDGIPYAAKDNIAVRGLRLSCASGMLENYISPYDASVISALRDAGAVLLGKTNLDEFAMGTGTESSHFGRVKNPLDTSRVSGGSSGGSAAAVAADLCSFALGSDTGGSVRQPAAFCGIIGLRPTYSALSRMGLVGFAPSLDTIGIMSRTVGDCATVLRATAKRDPLDSTSAQFPTESLNGALPADIRGKRIALIREIMELDISEGQRIAHSRAADALRELGAEVIEVSVPSLHGAFASYYAISSAEASSNLARFDGVRYGKRAEDAESLEEMYVKSRSLGFGNEVKRRITFGALILSGDYKKDIYENALRMRARINAELAKAFSASDVLMLPTSSGYAYKAGDLKDELFDAHLKDDVFCALSSLSGLPSISLPCSTVRKLPLGIQLIGRAFEEKTLFDVAAHLQCALN